ncbi:PREDICTED: cytochrome P450 CYP72A219-like isoform X2 [Erythranthe guttata]|uniref:cytochrome P450 CYP72A219-like isoform X2 n=1 Tax=Erythranthe guttata TaxID=4155 RepID=UPI00064D97F3|nr:PREDICTED: cytochrome P450 CYP72A219-like isoform X2 [Erythranthe guttata]|eukprot:XP_012850655.1 PREDICTED: cytochrome P450 CYP72A219-like isoform X2 [Erythranthe guttata]
MEATLALVLISLAMAASITCAAKLLNFLWLKPRKLERFLRNQGLHGTPYRPFIGDLKEMTKAIKAAQPKSIELSDEDTSPHIFAYYYDILKEYGNNSFFWFGPWPKLNIVDPDLIKEILKKYDVFEKPLPETGKVISGGIALLEGEKWSKHRKIINPAFHLHKLKNMAPAIGLSCTNMISKLKSKVCSSTDGSCEIDMWACLEDFTGDVISRTAFGSNHDQGTKIIQLQREKLKLTLQLLQFSFIPGWRYLPTKLNKKVKAINDEIESLLRGIIDKRQKAMDRGDEVPSDDLLGILMESNLRFIEECGNKNKGMSIEDVIEECKLFYVAGSETTACLLVWTMVLLCEHTEWQTRAREEVIRVFVNSEPSFEGLNQLKNVTMILQEVLRLYPPLPMINRCSTKTVKLGNLTIPAGVHLLLMVGLVHRDSNIWGDDANEFNPLRFSDGVSKVQSSFVPFSSGPRICIAQNFAMVEAKMALATILRSFSFELSPSYLHAPFSVTTLQPQYGAPIIFQSLEPFRSFHGPKQVD